MRKIRHAWWVAALTLLVGCGTSSTSGNSISSSSSASDPGYWTAAQVRPGVSVTQHSAPGSSLAQSSVSPAAGGSVTLVTHDSFAVDKKVLADFEASSGIKVTLLSQGDAGALVNKLILTKGNPLGDAVFGIDNSFASRAEQAGILDEYTSPALPAGARQYVSTDLLTPVDYGDVCVNVDHNWFKAKNLAEPKTFEDLAKPEYKNLLVTESVATSSPGLIFLLGTIAHFGANGWQAYWTSLQNNGLKVTAGWNDAYSVDFSGSAGKGDRPLVVSYASSPPDEVHNGVAQTGALLDTCFRQIEYAGVLAGAKNPAAARKVVDFLLSKQFQDGVAEGMYVYPVDSSVALPADWKKFAPVAPHPLTMDPAQIAANRDSWISQWTDLVQG